MLVWPDGKKKPVKKKVKKVSKVGFSSGAFWIGVVCSVLISMLSVYAGVGFFLFFFILLKGDAKRRIASEATERELSRIEKRLTADRG